MRTATRPIALAALISASLAGSGLPAQAQTVTAHSRLMVETADTTVREGSDAGPTQTGMPGQDANVSDLPRIATHAPTPLGRPVPAAESAAGDSQ